MLLGMPRKSPGRGLGMLLVAITLAMLFASGIGPVDRLTWAMEVVWVALGLPLVLLTWTRFPLTRLLCILLVVHAGILVLGGHYTYVKVPLGEWFREWLASRAGAASCQRVVRVEEFAGLERQAAAADALVKLITQAPERLDALLEFVAPQARQARPVGAVRCTRIRQFGKCAGDALEADADALRTADEGNPAQHVAAILALVAAAAFGTDQSACLIEVQRRYRHAAAFGDGADREQLGHA